MTEPLPRASASSPLATAAGLLVLIGLAGAVLWWALAPPARPGPVVVAWEANPAGRPVDDPYVGSKTCAECHPAQAARFDWSGHSRTLIPVGERRIASELDGRTAPDPEHPDVSWSFAHTDDGRLAVTRHSAEGAKTLPPIDFAFGSGQHATTFVSLVDRDPVAPLAVEHRLTHFAAQDALDLTPGHQADMNVPNVGPYGRGLTGDDALKCFRCHTTRLSRRRDDRLDFATLIPQVSCERCHGPGRAHVEAALRDAPDLSMPLGPGRWTADEMMSACGACHRHPAKVPPGLIRPDNLELTRFQPIGLMQSRCYTASNGALSCVTCHDPHGRARTADAPYEAICLDCHQQPASQAVCSVSPRSGCIACHMPAIDSGQGVPYTDHWIRVRSPLDPQPGSSP